MTKLAALTLIAVIALTLLLVAVRSIFTPPPLLGICVLVIITPALTAIATKLSGLLGTE
jgi:hypothetical protein